MQSREIREGAEPIHSRIVPGDIHLGGLKVVLVLDVDPAGLMRPDRQRELQGPVCEGIGAGDAIDPHLPDRHIQGFDLLHEAGQLSRLVADQINAPAEGFDVEVAIGTASEEIASPRHVAQADPFRVRLKRVHGLRHPVEGFHSRVEKRVMPEKDDGIVQE